MMNTDRDKQQYGIRWLRAIIAGLLIEIVLMAVSVPFFAMERARLVEIIIAPATLVAAALFGAWAAKGASDWFILHGTLAGAFALLIYGILIAGASVAGPDAADTSSILSLGYIASHLFKVLGGALGGYLVWRKRQSNIRPS